jgi:hypothetical protein
VVERLVKTTNILFTTIHSFDISNWMVYGVLLIGQISIDKYEATEFCKITDYGVL